MQEAAGRARDPGLGKVFHRSTLNSEETGWPCNKTGATRLGFPGGRPFR
ncbi:MULTISPECIES: hypothetical protein [Streptomyces]|nr:hypothetical protein [Streptomyces sp. B15]MBQ1123303.1 hypothetical protein [Streptomyces sp. B15]